MYRLIIVDDEVLCCEQLAEMINWEELGFHMIKTFCDGADALEFLKDNSADVILTDIKMPLVSGVELARECFLKYPETKIVLFSAYKEFEYARSAIAYNVKNYILKPISYSEVVNTLVELKKELDEFYPSTQQQTEDFDPIIKRAIDYLEDHYYEDIGLKEISSFVGLNATYFSSYFKQHTGEKYVDYLVKIRMEKAKAFIENEIDCKMYTLGERVGYKSTPHFYKVFRGYFGFTPSKYKERMRKKCAKKETEEKKPGT